MNGLEYVIMRFKVNSVVYHIYTLVQGQKHLTIAS
jgi:hypothetical protein